MKSWLLDVNVLLGCCWTNHADHTALFTWLTNHRRASCYACKATQTKVGNT